MMFSRSTLLAAFALCGTASVNGFSPQAPNSMSVSQIVQESQRYQPRPLADQVGNVLDEDDYDMPDIDSPPAEDYILNVGELEENDEDEVGEEDDGEPPAWYALQQRVDEARNTHKRHEKDTGSPEYQVAGMTERVSHLTRHLQQNPKDFSTRRGLVALVNKRRRLLNYLAREDEQRYVNLVTSLGIRHKAPGRVWNRADLYFQFPKQKAVKKHLVTKRGKK